jgi:gluconate kinase
MIVVFGRPGAGKTTIADCAVRFLSEQESLYCVGLDLDVCVPQWMRENFGVGVYPTLRERQEFALDACDYVDAKLQEQALLQVDPNITMAAIVSFSFVNTDLRDIYRSRFPHAIWALVDTTEAEATDRINQREGHFFKGALPQQDRQASLEDNREWNFAPVMFPHIKLPGINTVEQNSRTISAALLKEIHKC